MRAGGGRGAMSRGRRRESLRAGANEHGGRGGGPGTGTDDTGGRPLRGVRARRMSVAPHMLGATGRPSLGAGR